MDEVRTRPSGAYVVSTATFSVVGGELAEPPHTRARGARARAHPHHSKRHDPSQFVSSGVAAGSKDGAIPHRFLIFIDTARHLRECS